MAIMHQTHRKRTTNESQQMHRLQTISNKLLGECLNRFNARAALALRSAVVHKYERVIRSVWRYSDSSIHQNRKHINQEVKYEMSTRQQRNPAAEPRWARPKHIRFIKFSRRSFHSFPTGMQLKRKANALTVTGLTTKHAVCRITFMMYPVLLWRMIIPELSPVKRICVFEHSVMTNFNCACPAIQRGQGSGFLSEGSSWLTACMGERGGSVVECRTPEREVGGSKPTAAVLCPWARHFTPRKYRLITQEAVAPSRHDWKIVGR